MKTTAIWLEVDVNRPTSALDFEPHNLVKQDKKRKYSNDP